MMRKRELLFGFGVGLIVAAACMGWLASKQVPTEAKALSSEQIKNAAKELQMVVLTKEEYEQWQQEKKVNVKPSPTAPKAPVSPAASQTVQPKAPTVKEAAQPQAKPPEAQGEERSPAQSPLSATPPVQAQTGQPLAPKVEAPQPETLVSFTVPYKATAEGVAKQLVQAGILPADNKFVDELRAQDKLNRIRVGTYQVSTPVTEAEIVKLITTPPKK